VPTSDPESIRGLENDLVLLQVALRWSKRIRNSSVLFWTKATPMSKAAMYKTSRTVTT